MGERYIANLICHEETHAVAFQDSSKEGSFSQGKYSWRSGYTEVAIKRDYIVRMQTEVLFNAFNEAVTDLIAAEVYYKYSEIQGEKRIGYREAYDEEVRMFRYLCAKICQECGIDQVVLWKVIQRGYFAGEQLSGEKMERLFQQVFPEEFKQALGKFKNDVTYSLQDFFDLLCQASWTENDKTRIRRWILSIYHSIPAQEESGGISMDDKGHQSFSL